jgi:hypothetical protein
VAWPFKGPSHWIPLSGDENANCAAPCPGEYQEFVFADNCDQGLHDKGRGVRSLRNRKYREERCFFQINDAIILLVCNAKIRTSPTSHSYSLRQWNILESEVSASYSSSGLNLEI